MRPASPSMALLLPLSLLLFSNRLAIATATATATATAATKEYRVGGADGWTAGINYLTWSDQQNFTVGDLLVFSYVKEEHNVYEVTEQTFRSCDSTNGVLKAYESGDDRIELRNVAAFYFICSVKGHCEGGMKVRIRVAPAAGGGGAPTLPSPPVTDAGGTVAPPMNGNGVAGRTAGCRLMMLLGLTCLMRF